ncbi:MAG TPA: hypothetical protein VGB17_06420 [Pyrinomonadaceae bacterium]
MRREGMLLNLVCLIMALVFLGLVALTIITAGSVSAFFSIDNLFLVAVCLFLALVFLSIPAAGMLSSFGFKNPLGAEKANAPAATRTQVAASRPSVAATKTAGTLPGAATQTATSTPTAKDAKGRTVPPDVQTMMKVMNKEQEKG